jgi:hypothetical protein
MSYAYTTRLPQPFSAAVVGQVRAALKDQGFGVLTRSTFSRPCRRNSA